MYLQWLVKTWSHASSQVVGCSCGLAVEVWHRHIRPHLFVQNEWWAQLVLHAYRCHFVLPACPSEPRSSHPSVGRCQFAQEGSSQRDCFFRRVSYSTTFRYPLQIATGFPSSSKMQNEGKRRCFAYSSSSCCQQLGLLEPSLRGTAISEDQVLQQISRSCNGLFLSRRVFCKAMNKDRMREEPQHAPHATRFS